MEKIVDEQDLVQMIKDNNAIVEMSSSRTWESRYNALHCDIKTLSKTSPLYEKIHKVIFTFLFHPKIFICVFGNRSISYFFIFYPHISRDKKSYHFVP